MSICKMFGTTVDTMSGNFTKECYNQTLNNTVWTIICYEGDTDPDNLCMDTMGHLLETYPNKIHSFLFATDRKIKSSDFKPTDKMGAMPMVIGRLESYKANYLYIFDVMSCFHGAKSNCTSEFLYAVEQNYVGECSNAKFLRIFLGIIMVLDFCFLAIWIQSVRKYYDGRRSML